MKVFTSISRGAALKTNAGQLEPEHTHWTEIMLDVIDAVAEGCRIEQNDILFPPLQKEKNSRILIVQENKMIEVFPKKERSAERAGIAAARILGVGGTLRLLSSNIG